MEYTEEQIREHRLLYVEALESGKFNQVVGVLTRLNEDGTAEGHCCLGVACEVAMASGVELSVRNSVPWERTYDGNSTTLPTAVRDWLGVAKPNPWLSEDEDKTATSANDVLHWNFVQIAQAFRQLWGL